MGRKEKKQERKVKDREGKGRERKEVKCIKESLKEKYLDKIT